MSEYLPLRTNDEPPSPSPSPPVIKTTTPRVASLDVFRGLCVFLMMFVDYGGAIFPVIGHAPWNGLHLADFVMPFFLFIAGLSLAIAYKKVDDRMIATKTAIAKAIKLFLLGVFLQGGYLHGAKSLTYGVDILKIRWMGILQRISIGYLVAALCEIWLPCKKGKRFGIVSSFIWQWCVVGILCAIYCGLVYGLFVTDWSISKPALSLATSNGTIVYEVKCGLRGDLSPACNSAGMIDRYVLGSNHLYAKPSFGNLKECNKTKIGIPESSPSWCHASFDPEGSLGSLTAAVTCIIGLQFGHILVQVQDHKERLQLWSMLSVYCSMLGVLLAILGIPLNKSLYTVSYTLVTSATAGFTFNALYLLVDVWNYKRVMYVLEWMGVHSLSIFILLTSNIAIVALQGFYLGSPKNNIIHWIISFVIPQ